MNGKLGMRTKMAVLALSALAFGAPSVSASNTQIFVTVSGVGIVKPAARVDSVSGGTTSGGRSVSTPNGVMTTASIALPLVIKRSEPDHDLLKFAAASLLNPNSYQAPSVKSQTFDEVTGGEWKISHEQQFDKVVPTRIDIPGTFGSVSQRGSFVITANVLAMHDSTPSTATPLPSTQHASAYPAYWIVRLGGFSTSSREPSMGYFTFEPFSLSAKQTTLALTIHSSQVTKAEVTNWATAHPSATAIVEWTQTGSTANTRLFAVSLKDVTLSTISNDASTPTAITAHLTGTISSIDAP